SPQPADDEQISELAIAAIDVVLAIRCHHDVPDPFHAGRIGGLQLTHELPASGREIEAVDISRKGAVTNEEAGIVVRVTDGEVVHGPVRKRDRLAGVHRIQGPLVARVPSQDEFSVRRAPPTGHSRRGDGARSAAVERLDVRARFVADEYEASFVWRE